MIHRKFGIIHDINPVFVQGLEPDSHIRFQFIGLVLNGKIKRLHSGYRCEKIKPHVSYNLLNVKYNNLEGSQNDDSAPAIRRTAGCVFQSGLFGNGVEPLQALSLFVALGDVVSDKDLTMKNQAVIYPIIRQLANYEVLNADIYEPDQGSIGRKQNPHSFGPERSRGIVCLPYQCVAGPGAFDRVEASVLIKKCPSIDCP